MDTQHEFPRICYILGLVLEFSILQIGKDVGLKLNEALMKGLEEENKLGRSKPIYGFFR